MSNETLLEDLKNLGTLLENGQGMVHANFMLAQEDTAKLDERIAAATAVGTTVSDLYLRCVARRLRYLRILLEEQEARCRRVREEVTTIAKNIQSF